MRNQHDEKNYIISYEVTDECLAKLKDKIPSEIFVKLELIKFKNYSNEKKFINRLKKEIGEDQFNRHQALILKSARQREKKEKDYYITYILSEDSILKLTDDLVDQDIITKLDALKNVKFASEKKFRHALKKHLSIRSLKKKSGKDRTERDLATIVHRAKKKIHVVKFTMTDHSFATIKDKIPGDVVAKLGVLKGKKFSNATDFENSLKVTLGRDQIQKYGSLIFSSAKVNKLTSFILTDESMEELVNVITPPDVLEHLESIKNKKYFTKFGFIRDLKSKIGNDQTRQYKSILSRYAKTVYRETIESILVAFIAAMILRIFVVQAFRIPTGSMKDTLLIGDFLLVNKFMYGVRTPDRIPLIDVEIPHFHLPALKEPRRGDIIVFKYPQDMKLDYIKRCVALPGQTVEIRNGILYIDNKPEGNSKPVGEKYDSEEGRSIRYFQITMENGKKFTIRHFQGWEYENYGPIKVPEGHYFMMGDNRDNSADSRSWGFLPRDNIVGEALIIYWSWDKNVTLYPWHRIFNKVRWTRITRLIR